MKILIDTNIILDVLLSRAEHLNTSMTILQLADSAFTGFITVYQTRDIFYILRRNGQSASEAKESVRLISTKLSLLNADSVDVINSLNSDMTDYEDALLAYCAMRQGIDYIVTRNTKDFEQSPIKALSPGEFIKIIAV